VIGLSEEIPTKYRPAFPSLGLNVKDPSPEVIVVMAFTSEGSWMKKKMLLTVMPRSSQSYVVALMTKLLDLKPGQCALEVGTGSGYPAAVLEEMDIQVYTIEIVPELGR
jgi:protein-L-isoaspartate O-methyltransferase